MIDLQTKHYFSGREYAKEMHMPKGSWAETHEHKYDHISILASGSVLLTIDDVHHVHVGPTAIVIPALKKHRVSALTDVVWFCVHATDETDPETVDEVLICHSQP